MAKFTPGGRPKPFKPPQGQSHKTLTVKVKAHTRPAPAARALNALDMPVTPGSSLTVRQAQRMAANAVKVKYGGQEQGINQQIAQQGQIGRDQQDWYRAYLSQLAAYQTDVQNRAAQTNTAVQQQADSIRSLDQGQLTSQQQAMNTDAAARGATVDPNVGNRASQASVVRQALEGGLGALIAARGQAAGDYASNQAHVVAPIQQGQAQAANARQQTTLEQQLTGLKGQKGAYAQSFIDSLTGSEAKNVLAASIASGKDSTQLQTIKERTRHDKATEQNTAAGRKATAQAKGQQVNQYGYTAKQWSAFAPDRRRQIMAQVKKEQRTPGAAKKPAAGPGSLSASSEASVVSQIHQVAAMIQRAPKSDSTGVKLTDHELRSRLASPNNPFKKVIDPRIVNIAFDLARRGGLSTPNVKAAHDLGIHVNGHFKRLAAQPKSTVKPGALTTGPGAAFGNPSL